MYIYSIIKTVKRGKALTNTRRKELERRDERI
nr:MAG TPA: hypothetical protein [Caudoviricetes sp.]